MTSVGFEFSGIQHFTVSVCRRWELPNTAITSAFFCYYIPDSSQPCLPKEQIFASQYLQRMLLGLHLDLMGRWSSSPLENFQQAFLKNIHRPFPSSLARDRHKPISSVPAGILCRSGQRGSWIGWGGRRGEEWTLGLTPCRWEVFHP